MKSKEFFQSFEHDPDYLREKKGLQLRLDLANQILDLRMKRGYSQKKLAELAGTKQANISRLESGLANPTLNLLERIAAALEVECEIRLFRSETGLSFSEVSSDLTKNNDTSIDIENWPIKKDECLISNMIEC